MLLKETKGKLFSIFSPLQHMPYLSATVRVDESGQNIVELNAFDVGLNSPEMNVMCQGGIKDSISSLAWSKFGSDNEKNKYGIIIAGTSSGKLNFFSPDAMFEEKEQGETNSLEAGFLGSKEISEEPINSLAVNGYRPSLIVSGGTEVLIHNIEKGFDCVDSYTPSQSAQETALTTIVSWNNKVQHIFASADNSGLTTIWDVKSKKSILEITDPSYSLDTFTNEGLAPKRIALAWNPDNPTQIALGCDDSKYSYLNIWDLRSTKSPVVSYGGLHTAGIVDISWSANEPGLILAASKDHKVVSWNTRTGDATGIIQIENVTKVSWSSIIKGLFMVQTSKGDASIYQYHDMTSSRIIRICKKPEDLPPTWLKRECGVAFGYGGKLLVYSSKQGPTSVSNICSLHSIVGKDDLSSRMKKFETELEGGSLEGICKKKAQSSNTSPADKTEWELIAAVATEMKESILEALGMGSKTPFRKPEEKSAAPSPNNAPQVKEEKPINFGTLSEVEAEGFFSELVSNSPTKEKTLSDNNLPELLETGVVEETKNTEHPKKTTVINVEAEAIIKQNLLVGDIPKAIENCFKCGRTAEALLLASATDKDTFERAKERFFQESPEDDLITSAIKPIVTKDLNDMVMSRPLKDWKETLVYCLCYSRSDEKRLIQKLGKNILEKERDLDKALTCFIVANDFDSSIRIWETKLFESLRTANHAAYASLFQTAFEKILMLKTVAKNYDANDSFDNFFARYASLAGDFGAKDLALKYLDLANLNKKSIQRIKERIIESNPRMFSKNYSVSGLPFPRVEIKVLASLKDTARTTERTAEQLFKEDATANDFFEKASAEKFTNSINGNKSAEHPKKATRPDFEEDHKKPLPNNVPLQPPQAQAFTTPPVPQILPRPRQISQPFNQLPISKETSSGKKIFNPAQFLHSGAKMPPTSPPPSVSQMRPPPVPNRPQMAVPRPNQPFSPGALPPPNIKSPDPHITTPTQNTRPVEPPVQKSEEEKKDNIFRKPINKLSPVPPPPPTVVMPSSISSFMKNTPPPTKGKILQQANFGIRPFKNDEGEGKEDDGIDFSKLAPDEVQIVEYFKQEIDILSQVEQNPAKRAELDSKIKVLYRRLLAKELTPYITGLIKETIKDIQTNNLSRAHTRLTELTSSCWDKNKDWILVLKRIHQFKLQLKK